jgi:nucleotide-binding universal stress UspA family protein
VYTDFEHGPRPVFPVEAPPPGLAERAESDARRLAEEGAELARSLGFDAMPLVDSGYPVWRRIVEVADEVNAHLLVLGSHGRTGISRLLLGSVAAATASHSDRDVLVVHLPSPPADVDSPEGADERWTLGAQETS